MTTRDGYILILFRVYQDTPYQPDGQHKRTIYCQHGFLSSSDEWIINIPDNAPGFIAASAGYDVWLGNSRGNRYSRKHKEFSIKSNEFWEWSFEELGMFD